ncbi:serine protease [Streptomyces sp. TS71-3]|uniref:S1 family peptidase n=1 Tax=Streptomyces sp. TS71-3 TaxID=2733862 RepID=UPI001B1BE900|nr:serine protease [Streptomyces sp. TS71-3]GHJ38313.1 serine protease [Streptomyces sp. TS71-3]
MRKPLVGAFCTVLLLGAGATPAMATGLPTGTAEETASAHHSAHAHVHAIDFAGTVALSNCSGSLVRMPDSKPGDPGLVLSNGHCLETGFPAPGEVIVDQPSTRTFSLLDAGAKSVGTLKADKVAYSTMTDTDITLYELNSTYDQIQSSYGIKPLTLSDQHPVAGKAITVVSGYWKQTYSCKIDGFVHQLKEGDWTWKDSVRYTPECETIGGTSGSPVVDDQSGQVVAVNNTGNEDGQQCTVNNPCEVDENGKVTVHQGTNYAEETYIIPACIGTGNKLDLNAEGCTLPKPAGQ